MNTEWKKKISEFISENPKYARFSRNDEFMLWLYSEKHPEEFIVPDFILQKNPIYVNNEKYTVDYDNKIFYHTLRKEGILRKEKFGWEQNSKYAGENELILRLAISSGFIICVAVKEQNYVIPPMLAKLALEKNWHVSTHKTKIFAIPRYLSYRSIDSARVREEQKIISTYL